jgi:2-octaprenyl-6-methoxyphenol hydroxylase
METPMNSPDYDVVICGAGPTGSALALLLARIAPDPARIAIVGRRFHADGPERRAGMIDPRTLAMNHGSRVLLEQLGAWPEQSASIQTVHVSQRGRLGRTLIRCTELGVPRLGCVVSYDVLLRTLHRAVSRSGVTLVAADKASPEAARPMCVDLGDRRISTRMAVQSDGSRPSGVHRDYGQHAVLATVRAGQPLNAWAFERFTSQGPLAVLPHPDGHGLYGVVWCCAPRQAAELADLDDASFQGRLRDTFGARLGEFTCVGRRHVFPLSLHAGPSLIDDATVAIGNAAQTLHPVAGQGLNLGLRDAAQLAQALKGWLHGADADPAPMLRSFAQARRADRFLTTAVTDFLPRIFATGNPVVQHACGLSLLALDLFKPLRTPLARHLLQGLRV